MPSESTIRDLKAAIREVEYRKHLIDEEYNALLTTLRYFEAHEESSQDEHSGILDKAKGVASRLPDVQFRRSRQEPGSGSASNKLRDAIYEILSAERPIHRSVILDRLTERGIVIPGRNPSNNLGAHLSIDPRFISVSRGVWDLADSAVAADRSEWDDESYVDEEQDESDDVPW